MNWYKNAKTRRNYGVQPGLFDGVKKSQQPSAMITRYGNEIGIRFNFEGKMYTCPIYNPQLLKNLQKLISRNDSETIRNRFIPNFGCFEE